MKILIVEDSKANAQVLERQIRHYFRKSGITDFEIFVKDSLKEGLGEARRQSFGLAIVDATLAPDSDAANTLRHTRDFGCPVIIYSASEDLAKVSYDSGAVDFIWKGDIWEDQIATIARVLAKYHDSAYAHVQRSARQDLQARISRPHGWRQNVVAVVSIITGLSIISAAGASAYNSIRTSGGLSVASENRMVELEKEPKRREDADKELMKALEIFRKAFDDRSFAVDARMQSNDTRDQKSEDDRAGLHNQVDGVKQQMTVNKQDYDSRLNRMEDKIDRALILLGENKGRR